MQSKGWQIIRQKKTVDKPEMSGYIDVEKVTISLAGAEKTIFEALRRLGGRAHIDDIIASSGLPASDALGSMTMLEIDGYAVSLPGGYYALPGL